MRAVVVKHRATDEPSNAVVGGIGKVAMIKKNAAKGAAELKEALVEAADLCEKRGGYLSPHRKKVLSILLQATSSVKAYDKLSQLKDDKTAKPQTVYRAIDFLVGIGLVHRVASLHAYVPCQHWGHAHTAALLICNGCGAITELDAQDLMATLTGEAADVDFKARDAVVEVHGTCPDCR